MKRNRVAPIVRLYAEPATHATYTLSLHDALPIYLDPTVCPGGPDPAATPPKCHADVGIGKATFRLDSVVPDNLKLGAVIRSEEHTSELQSHVNIVCRLVLEKKKSSHLRRHPRNDR